MTSAAVVHHIFHILCSRCPGHFSQSQRAFKRVGIISGSRTSVPRRIDAVITSDHGIAAITCNSAGKNFKIDVIADLYLPQIIAFVY